MPDGLIGTLASGPLDIVGDVHGEIEALESLLQALGYAPDGSHPRQRQLVFVGDLVDRGPDSPAVLRRVQGLVADGRAQCLLGNHELNLLRDVEKHGNSWWVSPDKSMEHPAARIGAADKEALRGFLATLPLALERDDLRVVHACWDSAAVTEAKAVPRGQDVLSVYLSAVDQLRKRWERGGIWARYIAEWRQHARDLTDPDWQPVLLEAMATVDADNQMANPVSVLTSGAERRAPAPFWAGNRWRMVERVHWWNEYADPVPVIVGHYWRRYSEASKAMMDKHGPDLFAGVEPHHWMGARQNVYCVDFSVGGRYVERAAGAPAFHCRLAAVRVPEWTVMHDDGETWDIGPPG